MHFPQVAQPVFHPVAAPVDPSIIFETGPKNTELVQTDDIVILVDATIESEEGPATLVMTPHMSRNPVSYFTLMKLDSIEGH